MPSIEPVQQRDMNEVDLTPLTLSSSVFSELVNEAVRRPAPPLTTPSEGNGLTIHHRTIHGETTLQMTAMMIMPCAGIRLAAINQSSSASRNLDFLRAMKRNTTANVSITPRQAETHRTNKPRGLDFIIDPSILDVSNPGFESLSSLHF